jgi:hypothetical protein
MSTTLSNQALIKILEKKFKSCNDEKRQKSINKQYSVKRKQSYVKRK